MEFDALELLPDEFLDELISADIDGELHAAVEDLGITVSVSNIQSWFTTSSRAAPRYLALRTAATRFSEPLGAPIDELSKRRMVKITLGRTPAQTSTRIKNLSLAVAASAACITLVVGIAVSLSREPASQTAKLTTTSPGSAEISQQPDVGTDSRLNAPTNLGVVADVTQLRTKIDALQANNLNGTTTTNAPKGANTNGGGQTDTATAAAQEYGAASCTASLPGATAASGFATVATATIGDQLVEIAIATDSQGRTLRWAYRSSDCSILFTDRT